MCQYGIPRDDTTREHVRDALVDAFNIPDPSIYGGRLRAGNGSHLVEKIIVVKEEHKDGTLHFRLGISFALHLPVHPSRCTKVRRLPAQMLPERQYHQFQKPQ